MWDQSTKKENRVYALALCVGFFVFTSAPMLFKNHRAGEAPALPSLNLRAIGYYRETYERCFNEHFWFRHGLARLNSWTNMKVFGVSPSSRIVLGRDSWLFYDDPNDGVSLRDFRGLALLSEPDLRTMKNNVLELRQSLQKRGVRLLIIVAPNKHTIYPEYLPSHGPGTHRGIVTRLDQIADALKDSGVDLIDLRKVLLSRKNSPYLLYSRTDTHWNAWGAFTAYEEIMKRVTGKGLEVDVLRSSDFRIECREGPGYGEMASMLGMSGLLHDSQVVMQPLKAPSAMNGRASDRRISDPGREPTIVKETKDRNLAKLVMFGDSFGTALIPYLSESFSRSVYIRTPDVDLPIIDHEKPDLVILEMSERYLQRLVDMRVE
jgi:alginate O-acetyltransferase complex protein AlgJ